MNRHVFVFCAGWCSACREFQTNFAELERFCPEHEFHWIDIEDFEDLADWLEIEVFPTIMLLDQNGTIRFVGSVEPRLQSLHRLITGKLQEQLLINIPHHEELMAFSHKFLADNK